MLFREYVYTTPRAQAYLSQVDSRMQVAINTIGSISRPMEAGFLPGLIRTVLGQQISTKACQTICTRLARKCPSMSLDRIDKTSWLWWRRQGVSQAKCDTIARIVRNVRSGRWQEKHWQRQPFSQVRKRILSCKGLGPWSVQMIQVWVLGHDDVFCDRDFGVRHGARLLYGVPCDSTWIRKHKKLFSPYGTTASLYLWAVASQKYPRLLGQK